MSIIKFGPLTRKAHTLSGKAVSKHKTTKISTLYVLDRKHTIPTECTLDLWLATAKVFTSTLYTWKYRENWHWNLCLWHNRITCFSLPFKYWTLYDRSSSIKRKVGCRTVGNRCDNDKKAVEDGRWKSGWQIKSCEDGWVGYFFKKGPHIIL